MTTGGPDSEFDRGIAVRPAGTAGPAGEAGAAGTYTADLGPGWVIGDGVNGGMLLAVVGNALRQALPERHPDPFSASAYYLSASRPGPASIRTEVLREGRGTTTAQASLAQSQDGGLSERIRVLATYGDLATLTGDVRTTARPPRLPPPDACVSARRSPPAFMDKVELLQRLDLRLDPACAGWVAGEPSGRGEIRGWLRMADGREPDPLLLLLAVDSLPPVTFDLGLFGWTPTIELTVHVRAAPAPGWLLVRHATRNLAGGMVEEDAEVWDAAGRLVAQSRQLARVPRSGR